VLLADRIAVDDCKIAAAVVVTLALSAIVLLAFSPAEAAFTGTLGLGTDGRVHDRAGHRRPRPP
jgi:hypothetical protein